MQPGTIFFDTIQQISKEKPSRELLVVLSDGKQYPFIAVKTTSSSSVDRGSQFGCQAKDTLPSFFLPLHSTYLKEDIWIRLDHFQELDPLVLTQRHGNGEVDKVCKLPKKILEQLLVCAISCKTISENQKKDLWNTLNRIDTYYSV